jgi:hypothetical protein
MKKEEFSEVFGDINENYVKEAETVKKARKPAWVKWGAMAACLCLVVATAVAIPNTLTSTTTTGSSTDVGNITEEGDRDVGMSPEELASAMLDAGYTQAEVEEYQSLGYQMTWAKWWKFYDTIDDNGGDFTLDALKTFSQEELSNSSQGITPQVYTLPQTEKMSVELVEWGGDHFNAIVVDAEDNSIFPVNAKVSVVFDYDTEILLDNGTLKVFNPDEPDAETIGWEPGTVVSVEFSKYEEYLEENDFYNDLFASYVEAESQ